MFDPGLGIACVVGTRPEVVKSAPVVTLLRRFSTVRTRLIATGQHRDLLDRALADFGLFPDVDLALMRPDQSPAEVAARGLEALSSTFRDDPPALVLAQGDTTTVLCAALAAFYSRIPFGHIEAGLRTGNPDRPFPEETQRVLTSHLSHFHFAPTLAAEQNLLREGIAPDRIHIVGNTVIDALKLFPIGDDQRRRRRYVLITAHRRENLGKPLERICEAVRRLLEDDPALFAVWPVHPNPRVGRTIAESLGDHPRVELTPPMGYREFLSALSGCALVMTDSGGVQEEAPAFGKSVVVLRDETERAEFLKTGSSRIVGTDVSRILAGAQELLGRGPTRLPIESSPVGDGHAAERIVRVLLHRFGVDAGPKSAEFSDVWGGPTIP